MISVNKAIATAVKTGKVLLGTKKAIESAMFGRAKLIVVAENCPGNKMDELNYHGKLSGISVSIYNGDSIDLGAVCGKPYAVSAVTIREPGDSDILNLAKKTSAELNENSGTLEGTDA